MHSRPGSYCSKRAWQWVEQEGLETGGERELGSECSQGAWQWVQQEVLAAGGARELGTR